MIIAYTEMIKLLAIGGKKAYLLKTEPEIVFDQLICEVSHETFEKKL
jgi:hypothetical protein